MSSFNTPYSIAERETALEDYTENQIDDGGSSVEKKFAEYCNKNTDRMQYVAKGRISWFGRFFWICVSAVLLCICFGLIIHLPQHFSGTYLTNITCRSDSLEGATFHAKCSRNGSKVPCNGEILAGTTARYSCKPRYVKPKNDRQIDVAICQPNGLWDFTDYKCVQECGVYTEVDNYVVNFGSGSVFYPWEVIVIRDFGEWNWMYYCSAVLLSARVVLSAPGCFIYNTDQYWVAILGDYDASYKIGEIYPADDEINYSVLILQRPIVFKAGIRPICLSQDKGVMATSDLTLNEMPQKVRIASDGCSDTKKLYNVADSKNQSSQIYTASMCKEMMSADNVADGTVEHGASFCVHWGSHKAKCLSKSEGAGVAIEVIEDKNRVHYLVGLLGSRKFVDENGDNYVWSVNMTSYIADLQSYVEKYSVT